MVSSRCEGRSLSKMYIRGQHSTDAAQVAQSIRCKGVETPDSLLPLRGAVHAVYLLSLPCACTAPVWYGQTTRSDCDRPVFLNAVPIMIVGIPLRKRKEVVLRVGSGSLVRCLSYMTRKGDTIVTVVEVVTGE